ncbi:MAG: PspA/IM30 family protein [Pseudomonadota bacterium]
MPLLNRISHLFTADVHALLDRIEDPEALLKQAIRDMEESLTEQQQRLQRRDEQRRLQERESERIQARLDNLSQHIDHAFTAGDESLVRQLVRQRLLCERQRGLRREHAQQGSEAEAREREQLAANRAALDTLRQKLAALELTRDPPSGLAGDADTISEQEVDAAVLAEKQRRRKS